MSELKFEDEDSIESHLRDVLRIHNRQLDGWKKTVEDWKRKCDKLTTTVTSLEDEKQQKEKKVVGLEAENTRLREELTHCRDRLLAPCRQCENYMRQVEHQQTMYNAAWKMMARMKKTQGSGRSRRGQEPLYDLDTIDTCFTETQDSEALVAPLKKHVSTAERTTKHNQSSDEEHAMAIRKEPFQEHHTNASGMPQRQMDNSSSSAKTKPTLKVSDEKICDNDHSTNSKNKLPPVKAKKRKQEMSENEMDVTERIHSDVSNNQAKGAGLKLARSTKRARYLEGPVTESKKSRLSLSHILSPESKIYGDDRADTEMSVMDSEQTTVLNLQISPPSHSSTPVDQSRRPLPDADVMSSRETRQTPAQEEREEEEEEAVSDADSPVFHRNTSILQRETLFKSSGSPSLFEEDDEDEPESPLVREVKIPAETGVEKVRRMSTQSRPSPSVITGRINQRGSQKDPASSGENVWLSSRAESSGRLTRGQKKLSQETSSNAIEFTNGKKGPGNKLVQTKLSEKYLQPKVLYLPQSAEFHGGRLTSPSVKALTEEEKELKDLAVAMQRSLEDMKTVHEQNELGLTFDSVMTSPQFTSTPCDQERVKNSLELDGDDEEDSPMIFKKPVTPRRNPTTPKRKKPSHLDQELRRSPRLKKLHGDSQDDTIDPNELTLGEASHGSPKRCSDRQGAKKPKTKRSLKLDMDCSTSDPSDEHLGPNTSMVNVNGSLDPDVRLSQFDPETSSLEPRIPLPEPAPLEPISFLELCEADSMKTQDSKRRDVSQSVLGDGLIPEDRQDTEDIDLSGTSVVFGPQKRASKKDAKDGGRRMKSDVQEDDNFDRVPQKKRPNYAYVDVVRKKHERQQLQTYACGECERYYAQQTDLTEEEIQEMMKNCRHKARFVPPGTPEHFWSLAFPDTQECEERGYLNRTQHKPSNAKRQRGYRKLFLTAKEEQEAREGATDNG